MTWKVQLLSLCCLKPVFSVLNPQSVSFLFPPDLHISAFSRPALALSLSVCSLTCRWTVQSEAEIQGYQRGAGSCPQWSEQLVKLHSDPRISSFTVAHLIWSSLFLLFSLTCPKCTIKLLASSPLSSFFFLLGGFFLFLTIKKKVDIFWNLVCTASFNSAATLSCRWTRSCNTEKCRIAPGPGPNNAWAQ